jgi:hypothetical protein
VQGDRLMGDIEFASAELYPFADQIYRLVRSRFLNAGSVGFQPVEWSFSSDKNRLGIDFRRQSLLEFSVCPVPALPSALVDGRSIAARSLLADADDRSATNRPVASGQAPRLPASISRTRRSNAARLLWGVARLSARATPRRHAGADRPPPTVCDQDAAPDQVAAVCAKIARLRWLEEAWR